MGVSMKNSKVRISLSTSTNTSKRAGIGEKKIPCQEERNFHTAPINMPTHMKVKQHLIFQPGLERELFEIGHYGNEATEHSVFSLTTACWL